MNAALAGVVGVVMTALVSLLVARRNTRLEEHKSSGTVATSDAGLIWKAVTDVQVESEKLRLAYKEQAEECRAEMKEQAETYRAEMGLLRVEVEALRTNLKGANVEIDRLKDRIADQLASNERSNVATAESLARIEAGAEVVASDLAARKNPDPPKASS